MSPVVDAALALRAVLPGEGQAAALQRFDAWRRAGEPLTAPALWLYQVTSALARAVQRGWLTPAEGRQALVLAQRLGVQLVPPSAVLAELAYAWAVRLGRSDGEHGAYLALAEAGRDALWTTDPALARDAGQPWVHLVS